MCTNFPRVNPCNLNKVVEPVLVVRFDVPLHGDGS